MSRRSRLSSASSDPAVAHPNSAGGSLPSVTRALDVRGPYLLPLALALVARVALWIVLPYASEDAYITFRFARNLAAGHGFVFNPGAPVFGFTSPPWTLWMAAGEALLHAPLALARATALIADFATILIAGRLLERHVDARCAWAFTLFYAAWPLFPAVAMSGMENSPMIALLLVAALLAHARHPAGGPALALLALWRPEGVVAACVVALWAGWRERLVALAIVAVGLAGLAWAFGSPVPQSLIAKSQLYGTPGPWLGRHWWDWIVPFPFAGWPRLAETQLLVSLSIPFAASLVVGLPRLLPLRSTPLAAAIAGGVAVWLGYALLGVAYFYWYLALPLAALALWAALGFGVIASSRALRIATAAFVLGVWFVAVPLYVGRAQAEYSSFASAGRYLAANATPGDAVLLEPIGFVGWLAPVRVLDEVGLVTPEIARRRMQGPGWYTDVVRERRPRWLVLRGSVLESGEAFAGRGAPFRSLAERDEVLGEYERVRGGGGEAELQIWRRR